MSGSHTYEEMEERIREIMKKHQQIWVEGAPRCVGAMLEPGKIYAIPEGKTLEECWAQAGDKLDAIRGEKVEQEMRAGEMDQLKVDYHRAIDPLWGIPVPRDAFVGLGLNRMEKEREWEKALGFYGVGPGTAKWRRVAWLVGEYLRTVWRALKGWRVEEYENH